jgi:hypothetical protein
MSLKSLGNISNGSSTNIGSEGGDMVFYESEYFYSTMPPSLPSEKRKDNAPSFNVNSMNNRP